MSAGLERRLAELERSSTDQKPQPIGSITLRGIAPELDSDGNRTGRLIEVSLTELDLLPVGGKP